MILSESMFERMRARHFGIALLCVSRLCAPANAQEPDRWAFHKLVDGLEISGVKDPKFDAVVVTIKYPDGSLRSLDEVLPCCVDEIRAFQNRFVFVGSEYVTVVDRTSAALVDQFMHSEATVSPGGRFIALLPITDHNAMHRRRSPIQWVSDNQFAFLDYWNRQLRIVSVDVTAGVEEPRLASARVDAVPLIDAGSIPAYRRAEGPSAGLIHALALRPLKDENGALLVQLELFPEQFVRQKNVTIRITGASPRRLTHMSPAVVSRTGRILREASLPQKAAAVRLLRRSDAASVKRLQDVLVEEFNRAVAQDLREGRTGRTRTQRAVMTAGGRAEIQRSKPA